MDLKTQEINCKNSQKGDASAAGRDSGPFGSCKKWPLPSLRDTASLLRKFDFLFRGIQTDLRV